MNDTFAVLRIMFSFPLTSTLRGSLAKFDVSCSCILCVDGIQDVALAPVPLSLVFLISFRRIVYCVATSHNPVRRLPRGMGASHIELVGRSSQRDPADIFSTHIIFPFQKVTIATAFKTRNPKAAEIGVIGF